MAVHPGMMIKPEIDERGISQKEFAKMLGTQPSHLSEVLNGKRALTTELAVKIENAIGLPAKILLSALLSAGCIFFLFLTITHLAKMLVCPKVENLTIPNAMTIEACGAVGALAYTFSDPNVP